MKKILSVMVALAVLACSFAFSTTAADKKAGDVDKDGSVTVEDAVLILRYSAGLETLSASQLVSADVTYDGIVNSVDALRVLLFVSGNVNSLEKPGSDEGDIIPVN